MASGVSIDRPDKIGIGGVGIHGTARLLADVSAIDAAWYYTWTAGLPAFEVTDWTLGEDVTLTGPATNRSTTLGGTGNAWMLQYADVFGGLIYDFSLDVAGSAGARGGVSIDFLDAAGVALKSDWMPLHAGDGTMQLSGLQAPAGARSARIVTWGEVGGLELDNIVLVSGSGNAVSNGDFESAYDVDASDVQAAFVPMVWGSGDAGSTTLGGLAGALTILGFNEPDHRPQADMSVAEAIGLWPDLMATGARLGSPATTTPQTLGSSSWLGRFMDEVEARALRVDFIAVHYYSANKNVGAFRTFLENVYTAYDRPIWVTEWALVDWRDLNRFSLSETAAFLRDSTLMMDDLDFVERHAWFGTYEGLDGLNMNTHLFDASGDLTAVGQTFVDFAPDRVLSAGAGGETLRGGAGDDMLMGGTGDDVLIAGLGDDSLAGGGGKDTFILGEVGRIDFGHDTIADFVFGGAASDSLVFDFAGTSHALSDVSEIAAFAAQLATDGDDQTSVVLVDDDLVFAFGAGRGSVTLENASAAPEIAAAFGQATGVAPKVIGEYGRISASDAPTTVLLGHAFDDPVVMLTATTLNGSHPFSARLSSVGSDRFTFYLDEPNHLDGRHAVEDVSWMVVERGLWQIDAATMLEAGTTTTNVLSTKGTTSVAFDWDFAAAPIVLTTGQTDHGPDMLWTRASSVTTGGFELVLQEEEALNGGVHAMEDVGWVAMSRGAGAFDAAAAGTLFETSVAGATLGDKMQSVFFNAQFVEDPVFLAGIASMNGTDPVGLRFDGLDPTGIRAVLQEDTSRDAETAHVTEQLDWLALSGNGTLHGFDPGTFA